MKEWLGAHLGRESALADDLAPGAPRIELLGDRRVLVENHKGILEYSDTLMRINCGTSVLRIVGAELELRSLSLTELAVTGRICQLGYDE